MKKTRLYVALSIAYLAITVATSFSYYWPEAVRYASLSILDAPEEVLQVEQALIASAEQERLVFSPLLPDIQTVSAKDAPVKLTAYLATEGENLMADPLVFPWMTVLILALGQALLFFAYVYFLQNPKKFAGLAMIALVFLLPPAAQAFQVGFDSEEYRASVEAGEILNYMLVYQNFSGDDLEGVSVRIPVPQGMKYVPETVMVSDAEADIEDYDFPDLVNTDFPDEDASYYDFENKEVVVELDLVPEHDEGAGLFFTFKLKVKDKINLPETINFTVEADSTSGVESEAGFVVAVGNTY